MVATKAKNVRFVKLLLYRGANPEVKDNVIWIVEIM